MALAHAASGQVVDVHALNASLSESRTVALFKSDEIEVIRLILPAGKTMPSHRVKGEITLHCLEGEIDLELADKTERLKAGQLVWLEGNADHALTALRDSSVLVTIALRK